jgi:hypothetical protein
MIPAMEGAHGGQQVHAEIFAALDARAGDQRQLGWVREQGGVQDDASARAVLHEMESCATYGGMSDMNTRLQRAVEACRRSAAELAILNTLAATQ